MMFWMKFLFLTLIGFNGVGRAGLLFAQGSVPTSIDASFLAVNFWEQDTSSRIKKMASIIQKLRAGVIVGCEVSPRSGDKTTAHNLSRELGMEITTFNELSILSKFPIKRIYKYKLKHKRLLDRYLLVADILVSPYSLIRVASIHLAHEDHESDLPEHIKYAKDRSQQLKEIMNHLATLRKRNPVRLEVLGGDFNMLPFEVKGHEKNILKGWRAGNIKSNKTWRRIVNNKLGKEAQRLDYIYYFSPSSLKTFKIEEELVWRKPVNGVYLSDHLGVFQQTHFGW